MAVSENQLVFAFRVKARRLQTIMLGGFLAGRVVDVHMHCALQPSSRNCSGCLALTILHFNFRFPSYSCCFIYTIATQQRVCRFAQSFAMPGMTVSNMALPLASCIGFNGSVNGGLVLEKDGTTVIYPLGSTIIVRQLHNDQQQTFLQGHTDEVRVPSRVRLPCSFSNWGSVSRSLALSCHPLGGIWHQAS